MTDPRIAGARMIYAEALEHHAVALEQLAACHRDAAAYHRRLAENDDSDEPFDPIFSRLTVAERLVAHCKNELNGRFNDYVQVCRAVPRG